MREISSLKWISLCAILSSASACDPGIDIDPEPSTDTVIAVYNPDARTVPLPNTAALEPDGTLPSLAGTEDTALNLGYDYIGEYTGWSPATPINIPFSGELDETTIVDGSVVLYEVSGTELTKLDATPIYRLNDDAGTLCNKEVCKSVITLSPKKSLKPGTQYAVLVTKDIKGTNGKAIKEDAPVFFGLSKDPIFEDGEVKLGLFDDDPETAQSLEGIRQQLAPIVEGLDMDRDDIASLFTWGVVQNGFTILDPASSTIPLPNTLAIEADGTFPSSPLAYCPQKDEEGNVLAEQRTVACNENADCSNAVASLGGGFECISGICKNANCAQGGFDAYLDGLHGWPTSGVPITLPFTGELDESTLSAATVQLFKVVDGIPAKVDGYSLSVDAEKGLIIITPPVDENGNPIPLGLNETYFAFATRGLMTFTTAADGTKTTLPLLPPPEVFLAIQPNDVLIAGDACEAGMVATPCAGDKGVCAPFAGDTGVEFKCGKSALVPLGVDDAAAFRLHAIRPLLRGTTEIIEQVTNLKYSDLAAVWSWYTWTDTFSVFDPSSGVIPFPNTFLRTGCPADRPICNIPMGSDPLSMLFYQELSIRPGFSTTAPVWVPFQGPTPKAETLTTDSVLFAETHVSPPPRLTAEEYEVSLLEGNAVLKFNRPLQKGAVVAGLMTSDVIGGNGFPVQPTPAFVFLRSQYPLVNAAGDPTISQIPASAAATLEAARDQFKGLFSAAILFGFERSRVVNAWAYGTQDTTSPVQELRARALDEFTNNPPVVTETTPKIETPPFANGDGTTTLADQMGVKVDVSNLAEIHWNMEFNTYWFLDGMAHLSGNMPSIQPVGVSLFVPATTGTCAPPFDVAIVQHGHTGYRKRIGLAYANALAGKCIASIAMDLPLHGGRIVGSVDLHPDVNPPTSGMNFVSQDFVAVKSLFMQTASDLSILTKLIKTGAFDTALGTNFSNSDSKIGFIGQSIGSFIGTMFVTIESDVQTTVLNVGGGFFSDLLLNSEAFGPLFDGLGLPSGSFAELQTLHFIQWLADYVDPYAFAPYTIVEDPVANECGKPGTVECYATLKEILFDTQSDDFVEGADLPSNEVMIQMVTDESVVPNTGTTLVAKTMGVSLDDSTYPAGVAHGFVVELDPTDAVNGKAAACAREQGADFLAASFSGSGNVITATDCLNR